MDERADNIPKTTSDEYHDKINNAIKGIDNVEFLNFIYNFINSAIKKWL